MDFRFTLENFEHISTEWAKLQDKKQSSFIFSSPEWSKVWWEQFGSGYTLHLASIKHRENIVGIAPLITKERTASFIGMDDVCDYLDFIVDADKEEAFFNELLNNLASEGFIKLILNPVRPDSSVFVCLINIARQKGFQTYLEEAGVSLELNLPATWDEYLQSLGKKQRHELKRKLRRLSEAGEINYRTSTDANSQDIDIFLRLFKNSRQDKAAFLTPERESFLRSLAMTMAGKGFLTLNFLELDAMPVASTLCFDYRNDIYLYNSGYDPEYRWLSAGLISKVLCIQDSIQRGKRRFDFLKGAEKYKYELGGHEVPLYKCSVSLTQHNIS